jgi:hypothetical protein
LAIPGASRSEQPNLKVTEDDFSSLHKPPSSSGLTGRSSTPRLRDFVTGISEYWIARVRGR